MSQGPSTEATTTTHTHIQTHRLATVMSTLTIGRNAILSDSSDFKGRTLARATVTPLFAFVSDGSAGGGVIDSFLDERASRPRFSRWIGTDGRPIVGARLSLRFGDGGLESDILAGLVQGRPVTGEDGTFYMKNVPSGPSAGRPGVLRCPYSAAQGAAQVHCRPGKDARSISRNRCHMDQVTHRWTCWGAGWSRWIVAAVWWWPASSHRPSQPRPKLRQSG